jgi:hypothetical protein
MLCNRVVLPYKQRNLYRPKGNQPEQISQGSAPVVVQRKDALVRDKAHTRVLSAEPTGTQPEIEKLINKGTQGDLFKKGGTVDLDEDPTKHIGQGGNISWYRVKKPGFIYIRANKVISLQWYIRRFCGEI